MITKLKGSKLELSHEDAFVNTNHDEISLTNDTRSKRRTWKKAHCKVQGVRTFTKSYMSLLKDTEKDNKKHKIRNYNPSLQNFQSSNLLTIGKELSSLRSLQHVVSSGSYSIPNIKVSIIFTLI